MCQVRGSGIAVGWIMDGGAREVEKFKLTDFWVFGLFCLFVCLFGLS